MKRIGNILSVLVVVGTIVTCAVAQQSLGDVARKERQGKRPSSAKVYTNDDFAMVLTPEPTAAEKTEKPATNAAAGGKATDKSKPDVKAKVDEQKKNVAQLERELDVTQREYRLKVAVYYSDAGNNLRNSKKWAEDDRKQREEIETKQKAVNDAKQKLTDLQEQARKAGVRAE